MKAAGAVIVDPADIPTAAKMDACELEVLLYEFKDGLNKYLASLGPSSKVHSLEELIAFNEREKAREMPFFGQELLLSAQKKGPLTTPAYRAAAAKCRAPRPRAKASTPSWRASPRRDRRADREPGVDHRSRQRRSLHRRELDAGGRRRLPDHHRARRAGVRAARRHLVHRRRALGRQADRARLRLRTGDEASASADVCGHGGESRDGPLLQAGGEQEINFQISTPALHQRPQHALGANCPRRLRQR